MIILGVTDQYLVVMGQYGVVLVSTWWNWVSITWYCLVLSGNGLVWAFMPVYIEKSGDLDGCYHSRTTSQ